MANNKIILIAMSNSKLDVTRNYIRTMYSDGEEFRFDLLSRKTQIMDDNLQWRNLTDKDICTIACNCAQATGANITDREVRCVLGSDLVRDVHPLREYIRSLPPYNADYVTKQASVRELGKDFSKILKSN